MAAVPPVAAFSVNARAEHQGETEQAARLTTECTPTVPVLIADPQLSTTCAMIGTGQPADTLNPELSDVTTGSSCVGVQPVAVASGTGPRADGFAVGEITSSRFTICVLPSLKASVTLPV